MSTEKRVLVAAMVSALFLSWYAHAMTRLAGPPLQRSRGVTKEPGDELKPSPELERQPGERQVSYLIEGEDVVYIESAEFSVEIGRTHGDIRRVTLKKFKAAGPRRDLLQLDGGRSPLLRPLSLGQPLKLIEVRSSTRSAWFVAEDIKNERHDILYEIDTGGNMLRIKLNNLSSQRIDFVNSAISFLTSFARADEVDDLNNTLESVALYEKNNKKYHYKRFSSSAKAEQGIPRGTQVLSFSERYFCFSIREANGAFLAGDIRLSQPGIVSEVTTEPKRAEHALVVYLGPRDYFHMRKSGFESAFPVGAIGKLGLIFLAFLSWIAGVTRNYGVAIISFSALVTCATAPFAMASVKSMKKMQELKPMVDKIMAQHKSDPARANREVFALYKERRASPLGGCLPLLLQMPILIALFQALQHFVELRGESFLWIADLSMPDRLATLPFSMPLIGNELNLLPILMAIVMYVQTKISQANVKPDKSNPAASLMSGPLMAAIFGVMFYHFQSGLVLYWMTNSLTSILWYRLVNPHTTA